MARQKTFKSYAAEKCLIGYGVVNGLVNAVIFRAMHAGAGDALFGGVEIAFEMTLTGFLLGAILVFCVAPLTRKDKDKGAYRAEGEFLSLAKAFPAKRIFVSLVVGSVSGTVAFLCSLVAIALMPLPLDVSTMMVLKGSICAVSGAVAGFLTIVQTTYSRANFGAVEANLPE